MSQGCPITVVIAVLNARETIERCLNSVIEQDYSNKKLMVVDGCSDDGTVEIIQKHQSELDWWVSEPDQGIYDAWNKALPHMEEGWVLFLGADDTLQSPDVLTQAAKSLLLADPATKIAYGQVAVVDDHGQYLAIKGEPWAVTGKYFTSTMTLPHQGVFHHFSVFQEFGRFNSELKIAGDYDLLLKILPAHAPMFIENLIVSSWRIGGISYDVKTPLRVAREFSIVRRLNGFHSFSPHLAMFYLKAYVLSGLYLLFGYRFTSWFAGIYRKLTGQWS